ncbi:MAG: SoxR reducing system RseC family protein [gamma proteobacterium symbiont of Taylorina sp.]|nr:SoxR reducing system RseC family protein [gamma proteobacterium symbiont of Taylorina sp.]
MIEEQAVVVKLEGKYVWLETQRQSSCGHCSVKDGCGTQVLGKALGNKTVIVRCLNSLHVAMGDVVVVGIKESALLKGSLLLYFLPLLIMIFSAGLSVMISQRWFPELVDFIAIISSFLGLLCGLVVSRKYVQGANNTADFEPLLLRKLEKSMDEHEIKIILPS